MTENEFELLIADAYKYIEKAEKKVADANEKRGTKIQDDDYECRIEEHFNAIEEDLQEANSSLVVAYGLYIYMIDRIAEGCREWTRNPCGDLRTLFQRIKDSEKVGKLEYKA